MLQSFNYVAGWSITIYILILQEHAPGAAGFFADTFCYQKNGSKNPIFNWVLKINLD